MKKLVVKKAAPIAATSFAQKAEPYCVFQWHEIAKALFREKGIEAGLWRVAVKLGYLPTTYWWGTDDDKLIGLPTAVVGIEGLALFPAQTMAPMVFDAADPKPVTPRERPKKLPGAKVTPTKATARRRVRPVADLQS